MNETDDCVLCGHLESAGEFCDPRPLRGWLTSCDCCGPEARLGAWRGWESGPGDWERAGSEARALARTEESDLVRWRPRTGKCWRPSSPWSRCR